MTHSIFKKVAGALGFGSFVRDWDTVAALMDGETDALALVSPDGQPVYINAAGKNFFKTSSLLQSVLDRVLDEETNRLALAKLEAAVKNKAETSVELLMRPLTGEADFWEWYSLSIKQLPIGTLWRVRDITADRAMETVMRQETRELAEFLDVLPIGLYQIDSGGVIHFVNQRFCDWLGYTNTRELKGKKLVDLLVGAHLPELDGFWHGELTFRTQTGGFFTAFVSHAIYDDNGETMLRASVVRDVMSRHERRESAKEAELGFSRLFTEAPVGIVFLDKENIITEANTAFLKMFSRQREDMIGMPLDECVDPADWGELRDKMAQVIMGQQTRVGKEVRLKLPQEKFAAVYITPMTEEDGDGMPDVCGFIAHFIDNTERRTLADQFTQAQKMQAIGQLAGGIAHDFNNLLTGVLLSTELLLQTHPPTDPDFIDLNNIHYSASRAANLVEQLLSYSRKEQEVRRDYFDVTDIFSELHLMLKRLLGTKISIQIENGRNLGFIYVDKTQFDQVFVNLAMNARDAMPDGGTFTITTRRQKIPAGQKIGAEEVAPKEYVVMDVSDTGCGISKENMQKIFEPFFSTKEKGVDSGSGLGLAMVYGNIRQWDGYIDVKSTVGAGTTFSLYLPRHSPEDVRDRESMPQAVLPANYDAQAVSRVVRVKPNVPKTGDQLQFSFAQEKVSLPPPLLPSKDLSGSGAILLVEDEDSVRAVTKKALTAKGYTIDDCTCAEEALEKIENGATFDLMITDMIMPGMNGVELASTLRQKGIYGKILLISGFSEEAARGEIKEMPNFHFLAKPFTLKEMCEKVKEIMEQ